MQVLPPRLPSGQFSGIGGSFFGAFPRHRRNGRNLHIQVCPFCRPDSWLDMREIQIVPDRFFSFLNRTQEIGRAPNQVLQGRIRERYLTKTKSEESVTSGKAGGLMIVNRSKRLSLFNHLRHGSQILWSDQREFNHLPSQAIHEYCRTF